MQFAVICFRPLNKVYYNLNFAAGDTAPGVARQIREHFLPTVGRRPNWARWTANDTLFVVSTLSNALAHHSPRKSLIFDPDLDWRPRLQAIVSPLVTAVIRFIYRAQKQTAFVVQCGSTTSTQTFIGDRASVCVQQSLMLSRQVHK